MVVDRSAIKRSDRGANYDDSSTPARQDVIHPNRLPRRAGTPLAVREIIKKISHSPLLAIDVP